MEFKSEESARNPEKTRRRRIIVILVVVAVVVHVAVTVGLVVHFVTQVIFYNFCVYNKQGW